MAQESTHQEAQESKKGSKVWEWVKLGLTILALAMIPISMIVGSGFLFLGWKL